ncbi:MAG: pyridoxal phosphate-dependent aminotransferase [Pseudomonadota bacterium]|nr:pyridoxal phosphate-dependent aminotransferase [Pseudomonadota bacterium]
MPEFADLMNSFEPSGIVEINNTATAMKADGIDVVNLSIGVPNFSPPSHAYDAGKAAIDSDIGLKYLNSKGQPTLLEAFRGRLKEDGFSYDMSEICITMGGKGALYLLFRALLDEGDEVVYGAPYWSSYRGMIKFCGGTPTALTCGSEQHYKLTPEQLDAAITEKTKIFLFNNPSNPTGMVYTEDQVKALAEVMKKHPHVWILSDDIYDKLIYDGEKFHHLLHFAPELKNRLFIMQSVSKNYGLPGLRIGGIAGPEKVLKLLPKIVGQTYMNIPNISQQIAASVFSGDHSFLTEVKDNFVKRRDIALSAMEECGLTCPKPSGAFYVFPDANVYMGTSYKGKPVNNGYDLCKLLLEEAHVATVPGEEFGADGCFRISYACPEAELQKGMDRLVSFFKELKQSQVA